MKLCLLVLACMCLFFTGTSYATPTPRVKPAPPAPVFLKATDYKLLDQFLEATDKNQWATANAKRQKLKDPIARSVADWVWFREDNGAINFQETDAFLQSHEGWPSLELIQKNAEKEIPDTSSAASVAAFFLKRNPVSGRGKIQLARSNITDGRLDIARELISDAWINHDWPSKEEKQIIARYRQYMTEVDHAEKADRQLFEIKATNTKRIVPYLAWSDRRKAEARIALLRSDANAVSLFNNLTAEERKDSGVLHAVTRYYRRKGEESTAIVYAAQAPLNGDLLRNSERWWTEKRLLMRWALKNGRYEDAYAMAAFSSLTKGPSFADAEFTAGWIALRFLNAPAKARPHFTYLDAGVTAPISRARAQYWIGRTFEADSDIVRANQHYTVAAAYPFTYYGQLGQERLTIVDAFPRFPAVIVPTADEKAIFDARPLVYAMRVLAELDRDREFIIFARELDDRLQSAGEFAAYEEFMIEEGKVFLSVRAGKVAAKNGSAAPHVSYPLINVPEEARKFAAHELILGLSRQESEFNPRAYSSARARGLMQLLTSTARITARKEGLPYSSSRLLDDPSYNMMIGAAHLKHLQERFDGSWIMTLAGYNAGPHRVDQWIETYGDPRNPNVDPVDWVELIPFGETRNYVQRVMENTQIYRARITGNAIAGNLSRDLVRGGGTVTAIGIRPPTPVLERASLIQSGIQVSNLGKAVPVAYSTETPVPEPITPATVAVRELPEPSPIADEMFPLYEDEAGPAIAQEAKPGTEPCNTAAPTAIPGTTSADDLNTIQLLEYLNGEEAGDC